jgi:hypothetical protein
MRHQILIVASRIQQTSVMMKKILFVLVFSFAIKTAYCQAPYNLPLPEKWGVEKIPFPIDFAPGIPYKGMEELRFAPGWSNNKSDEYWAYAFVWFIKGKQSLNRDTLNSYLMQYYNGLYTSNLKGKSAPPAGFTKADMKSVRPLLNDKETYEGTITTLDFLTGQPITFNARIRVRTYPEVDHTAILFEISPQAYQQPVWGKMNIIITGFSVRDDKDY